MKKARGGSLPPTPNNMPNTPSTPNTMSSSNPNILPPMNPNNNNINSSMGDMMGGGMGMPDMEAFFEDPLV